MGAVVEILYDDDDDDDDELAHSAANALSTTHSR